VDNSFNGSSGGGALSFSGATLSGASINPTDLPSTPVTCQGQACHIGYQASFTLAAGTYDLRVTGSNPFNGSYSVHVSAVPEPSIGALMLCGLMVLAPQALRRARRSPA
jgi:hypothetical protein